MIYVLHSVHAFMRMTRRVWGNDMALIHIAI